MPTLQFDQSQLIALYYNRACAVEVVVNSEINVMTCFVSGNVRSKRTEPTCYIVTSTTERTAVIELTHVRESCVH